MVAGVGGSIAYAADASNSARDAIVRSGNLVAITGCNRDFRDREALRALLQDSKNLTEAAVKSGQVSAADARIASKFYSDELKRLPLPDCRKVAHILSDEPAAEKVPAVPLHP